MLAITRRCLAIGLLTIFLAACRVVPDTGRPGPQPAPTPAPGPSADVLPTDTARHRIALLVPLSGENAAVGRSIANATTMALLDTNADNLRITTYDTALGAGSQAARAIADGNKLILGPLLREDVAPVASRARPASVPLITFSNDNSVAARDVFVIGHTPEQSVGRTVAYARAQGARTFAALIPDGDYGVRAGQSFTQAVAQAGGTVVATERFDRGNTSIVSAAERLKARGGYDAVLLAEGVRLSAMAGERLRDGAQPRLMGTELWSGEAALAGTVALRGAWFSAVSDDRYRQFLQSYQARFGEQPHRIATLGYDAVLLTLRVARDWRPGRDFPTAQLLSVPGGFLGIDGPFRFSSNGLAERAMEVRQVGNGAISVVDPAPTRF
jgi:branched-chain amino acid transport system substrate-binding protein